MEYDLIIIGAGPAGLSAAIYASRYKLKTLILSKTRGGTAATAYKVCNYPSYSSIKGFELMNKFIKHVEELKVPMLYEEVKSITKKSNFFIKTNKKEYECKKIIFATGTERSRLKVKGEGEFFGKGVSYCANCDALFFENKTVAVVGGSDAALTSALLLSEYASKVYIIYKRDKFYRAEPAWIELVEKEKKITAIFNEEITEIKGSEKVESIKLKSGKTLEVEGVFVEAGSVPNTDIISHFKIKLNENGYVFADSNQKTNVEGIYAAGDVIVNPLKQIVTAAAQGAIAAYNVYMEIKSE